VFGHPTSRYRLTEGTDFINAEERSFHIAKGRPTVAHRLRQRYFKPRLNYVMTNPGMLRRDGQGQ